MEYIHTYIHTYIRAYMHFDRDILVATLHLKPFGCFKPCYKYDNDDDNHDKNGRPNITIIMKMIIISLTVKIMTVMMMIG